MVPPELGEKVMDMDEEEKIVIPRGPWSFNDYLLGGLAIGCMGYFGLVIWFLVS